MLESAYIAKIAYQSIFSNKEIVRLNVTCESHVDRAIAYSIIDKTKSIISESMSRLHFRDCSPRHLVHLLSNHLSFIKHEVRRQTESIGCFNTDFKYKISSPISEADTSADSSRISFLYRIRKARFINIDIHISRWQVNKISSIEIMEDGIVNNERSQKLTDLYRNLIFTRATINDIAESVASKLKNAGYADAFVEKAQVIVEENTGLVKFYVNMGQKYIIDNSVVQDESGAVRNHKIVEMMLQESYGIYRIDKLQRIEEEITAQYQFQHIDLILRPREAINGDILATVVCRLKELPPTSLTMNLSLDWRSLWNNSNILRSTGAPSNASGATQQIIDITSFATQASYIEINGIHRFNLNWSAQLEVRVNPWYIWNILSQDLRTSASNDNHSTLLSSENHLSIQFLNQASPYLCRRLGMRIERMNNLAYDQSILPGINISHELKLRELVVMINVMASMVNLSHKGFQTVYCTYQTISYSKLATECNLILNRLNSFMNPTAGYTISLSATTVGYSSQNNTTQYNEAEPKNQIGLLFPIKLISNYFMTVDKEAFIRICSSVRLILGKSLCKGSGELIPCDHMMYAGDDSTIRGFRDKTAFVSSHDSLPIPLSNLHTISFEYHYRINRSLSVYYFIDYAGTFTLITHEMVNNVDISTKEDLILRFSTGFGITLATRLGVIRITLPILPIDKKNLFMFSVRCGYILT